MNIADIFTPAGLTTLGQVIMIDLMLAGDNVVVLGTLAAGLPPADRRRVLTLGIGISLVCLIAFAFLATHLLKVVGLLFAGGLLLLWVAWRLFRELRTAQHASAPAGPDGSSTAAELPQRKTFARAAMQVVLADLSMSLDNVLAVAGAAREHPAVLLFGLAFSVTLMAVAANLIARVIERHRWIGYLGLLVIIYVSITMIFEGLIGQETGILPRLLG